MLRDKIIFVVKLQKLIKQVSFCHPSQRNEHIKMWETDPNNYWVFSKMADFFSLIPWSSTFQGGGWPCFLKNLLEFNISLTKKLITQC